ncbi:MAG TPA: 50S ribosomal protein L10 [Acidimicrobiales bacterium]|nr:50S ribosomal protein L10 [Acidimicrobiales bacterium]
MSKVRPDKVAAVTEVAERVSRTTTAVVTEYRGLTVAQISAVRRSLRSLGADYKVFKNTLVRRAIEGTGAEGLAAYLEGPTAIAFVDGDVSAVAKALRDLAKQSPALVIKGGVMDGKAITAADLAALADLPTRDVMLARLAGLIASPMRTLAGLLKAVPQNLAYGLSALIDARGGAPAPVEPETATTPAGVEDAAPAASDDDAAPAADVEAAESPDAPEAAVTAADDEAAPAPDAPEAEATAPAEPAE